MKLNTNIYQASLAVLIGVTFATPASAIVTIDYVSVGNAGNAVDPLTGYGKVDHEYKIGKYEVTNAQYGEFLNAAAKSDPYGLYNSNMPSYGITRSGNADDYSYSVTSTLSNRPVVWVSWYDAARFANWLVNGQGSGSTETGAYTLNGNSGIINANPNAQFYIPTENEWYKAAYFNGTTYSLYPNGQNTITTANANYDGSQSSLTDVGSFTTPSPYGTYDQAGNAWEWNDTIIDSNSTRGLRGGVWGRTILPGQSLIASTYRNSAVPSHEYSTIGFRVASIPEPSAIILTTLFSSCLTIRRKR